MNDAAGLIILLLAGDKNREDPIRAFPIMNEIKHFVYFLFLLNKNSLITVRVFVSGFQKTFVGILKFNIRQKANILNAI